MAAILSQWIADAAAALRQQASVAVLPKKADPVVATLTEFVDTLHTHCLNTGGPPTATDGCVTCRAYRTEAAEKAIGDVKRQLELKTTTVRAHEAAIRQSGEQHERHKEQLQTLTEDRARQEKQTVAAAQKLFIVSAERDTERDARQRCEAVLADLQLLQKNTQTALDEALATIEESKAAAAALATALHS